MPDEERQEPVAPESQALQVYPQDFDDPKREFHARIVPFGQSVLAETVDSLQDESAVREVPLSSGDGMRIGPHLLQDVVAVVDSRSGVIAETDDKGNVQLLVTFPEIDKRGRTKRSRFYTGLYVEAIALDSAAKSVDLRQKGKEPRDLEIKNQIMDLAKVAGEEAQRKGDDLDNRIIHQGFEYKPPRLEPPTVQSVRLDEEISIDSNLIGRLTSFANTLIRQKGGRSIEQVKVQLARFTEHSVIARARGTMVDQVIPRTSLTLMVKTSKGSEAFAALRGSCGTMEQCLRRYLRAGEPDDLFAIVTKLCQQVLDEANDLDRAEGAGILGSRCPVIFSPEVAGVFAHECFGHPAEGDIIVENIRDASSQIKLKARLGSQVSEFVGFNVIDTPLATLEVTGQTIHRFNWGSFVIDRYGEVAKTCVIVEKGNMVEAMTNLHTHEYVISGMRPEVIARMNQRGHSGSSRHEGYSVPPIIRMRNTFILPDPNGPSTKEEMAAKYQEFKIKKGVYIKSSKGGWVDTRNGTFCIIGNLAYLIENGTVTNKPIKDVQVTGKLGDLLSMIGGIGNIQSMDHTFTGFCGKNNQWVPVDGGGPLVFLKDTQIGGGSYRQWTRIVADYAAQLEEVQIGRRSHEQVSLPEVEELRSPEEGHPHVCLLTSFLPFDVLRRVITGGRSYPTHELIWDQRQERFELVERKDRHAL